MHTYSALAATRNYKTRRKLASMVRELTANMPLSVSTLQTPPDALSNRTSLVAPAQSQALVTSGSPCTVTPSPLKLTMRLHIPQPRHHRAQNLRLTGDRVLNFDLASILRAQVYVHTPRFGSSQDDTRLRCNVDFHIG